MPDLPDSELVTADGVLIRLGAALRRRGFARSVARTAGFNFATTAAGALGGIIIARVVGPTVRGEYAAVTAWFAVLLIVGGMGQPAALCYYVARYPLQAREYVATSRALMLTTGTVAFVGGIILAPVLARGLPAVTVGYRIAFSASIAAFVGVSFTASLQARDLRQWNVVRLTQPVFGLIAIVVLWRLRRLTLDVALFVLAATLLMQFVWAYWCCRRVGLAPGRAHAALIRPLAAYGTAQIAAVAPAALNAQLDQLVLSQTVPSADLGRYAIAVSLSLLPMPFVSAIGNVAFPRLAAQREVTDATRRIQRLSVLVSAGLAAAVMVPLAGVSHWLVPLAFGPAYSGAVPLLWILAPGSVFLACGQVTSDLLRGGHHLAVVAWAQGIAAIFTVVLLLALLPFVGVYGAAIASTISYGIALAVMLRHLSRLSRRPHHAVAATDATTMPPQHAEERTSSSNHDHDGTPLPRLADRHRRWRARFNRRKWSPVVRHHWEGRHERR